MSEDYTNLSESRWGLWQRKCPEIGEIFHLALEPQKELCRTPNTIFRIIFRRDTYIKLEKYENGVWHKGHGWDLMRRPLFSILKPQEFWYSFRNSVPDECPCGRNRVGCFYHDSNQINNL